MEKTFLNGAHFQINKHIATHCAKEKRMTEIILTCCDYCNIECSEHPLDGRGVAVAKEKECIRDFGWIKTPNGIKCQQCQEDKEDEKN